MDEAPGVNAEVWRAIQGLRAGGDVRLLAIGNPVIVGGEFNDAFTTKRSMWRTHTISAFDTPNLAGLSLTFTGEDGNPVRIGEGTDLTELTEEQLDQNVQPYLCTRRWVLEMFQEWVRHRDFSPRLLSTGPGYNPPGGFSSALWRRHCGAAQAGHPNCGYFPICGRFSAKDKRYISKST